MASARNKLASKRVVVFGGSSGIGYAVAALALASEAEVAITASTKDNARSAAAKLKKEFPNGSIGAFGIDLFEPAYREDRLERLFDTLGKVDHIVFTAGDTHAPKNIEDMTYESILHHGQIRFMAAMLVAKVAKAYMTPGPSSSITLSNGYVFQRPVAGWIAETAWAGAIDAATRALAMDMSPIRVNCVSIGVVDTPLLDRSFGQWKDGVLKDQEKRALTGQIGKAEDVAEAYLGLMRNSNATASTVVSDGGNRFV